MTNIKLKRAPVRRDYDIVSLAAQMNCECTEEMFKNKSLEDEVCKPCGARQVLNGIVSLSELLS